jgi:hypothetical protein
VVFETRVGESLPAGVRNYFLDFYYKFKVRVIVLNTFST